MFGTETHIKVQKSHERARRNLIDNYDGDLKKTRFAKKIGTFLDL